MNNLGLDVFSDIAITYQWILIVLSIGLIITSLEEIVQRDIFRSKGILSFDVSKLSLGWLTKTQKGRLIQALLQERVFIYLLYFKFLGSLLLLILSCFKVFYPALIIFLLIFKILISLRNSYGLDGAHQMQFLLLLSMSVAVCMSKFTDVKTVCLCFISFELILSYFIAGLGKIVSPLWRGSHALLLVFSTNTYGNGYIFRRLKNNRVLASFLSWSVILFELSFISVLFLPLKISFAFCAIGVSFHLFNAMFMGLNNFFFTFLAAYPALLFCIQRFRV